MAQLKGKVEGVTHLAWSDSAEAAWRKKSRRPGEPNWTSGLSLVRGFVIRLLVRVGGS